MIAIVSAARRLSNLATAMLDLQADGVSGGDANDLGSPEFQRRVASNARGFMAAAEIEALGLAYGRVVDMMLDLADTRPDLADEHWRALVRLARSAATARAPGWEDRAATAAADDVLPLLAEGDRLTDLTGLCHPAGIRRMQADADGVVRRLLPTV